MAIGSPRDYLSRNRRAIAQSRGCPTAGIQFEIFVIVSRYPRDSRVNVFYSFQNLW